ncbi:hypothetical protein WKW77_34240 [Variovorax ureilyticus]|uniref:ABC transporter permease n=1 Tax=Variovorax ureilyticus TaxID=1836198 RepID=A0ABU8VR65_9BURK
MNINATAVFGRRKASVRKGWKPGAWAIGLVLAWLALLAVPMVGLFNLDAFAPPAADAPLKPWMPIYAPII